MNITIPISDCNQFSDIDISQHSAANMRRNI